MWIRLHIQILHPFIMLPTKYNSFQISNRSLHQITYMYQNPIIIPSNWSLLCWVLLNYHHQRFIVWSQYTFSTLVTKLDQLCCQDNRTFDHSMKVCSENIIEMVLQLPIDYYAFIGRSGNRRLVAYAGYVVRNQPVYIASLDVIFAKIQVFVYRNIRCLHVYICCKKIARI